MTETEKYRILKQITWDYNIEVDDIEAVLKGEKESAGHYTRDMIFRKIIESYSWFTVLKIFTPKEVQLLLNHKVISQLRSPSLKKKYEFVQKRLQEALPAAR